MRNKYGGYCDSQSLTVEDDGELRLKCWLAEE